MRKAAPNEYKSLSLLTRPKLVKARKRILSFSLYMTLVLLGGPYVIIALSFRLQDPNQQFAIAIEFEGSVQTYSFILVVVFNNLQYNIYVESFK
jgi:hypothetical protein